MNIEKVKNLAEELKYEMKRHDNLEIDCECISINEIYKMFEILLTEILNDNVVTTQ